MNTTQITTAKRDQRHDDELVVLTRRQLRELTDAAFRRGMLFGVENMLPDPATEGRRAS